MTVWDRLTVFAALFGYFSFVALVLFAAFVGVPFK